MPDHTPVLPGSTIGILGGGQLGCMLAMAARTMGYKIAALDPNNLAPIKAMCEHFVCAPFGDADAAAHLARKSDVVTIEIEHIGAEALRAVEKHAPLRPRADIVTTIHDRISQKTWLQREAFPVGEWAVAPQYPVEWTWGAKPHILKTARDGYDGRGQRRVTNLNELIEGLKAFKGAPCLIEEELTIAHEISLMIARKHGSDPVLYPVACNMHNDGILTWTALPHASDNRYVKHAREIAIEIAEKLDFIGVLTVEFFVTTGNKLYVNELAPRIHNSYHASLRACVTSHAEQAIRAICGLPLGSPQIVRPAAMFNLLGDLWKDGPPPFEQALVYPNVSLHLYGKDEPRAGRKMGHFTVTATNLDDAIRAGQEVYRRLARR